MSQSDARAPLRSPHTLYRLAGTMKQVVAAAAVVAVALAVAGVASARVATTVELRDTSGGPGDRVLFGTVDSPQGKCRSGRTVRVFVRRLPGKGGGGLE